MAHGVPGAPGGTEAGEGTRRRRERRRGGRDRGERNEGGEQRAEGHAPAHTPEPESRQPAAQVAPPAAPEAMLTAHEQPRHDSSADVPLMDEETTPPSVWTPVVPDEPAASNVPAPASALESAEPAPVASRPLPSYDHDRSEAPAPAAPRTDGGDAATGAQGERVLARPRSTPELPKVSLELPPDSGLVLIETARESVAVAESTEATEPSRPRRVRPTRAEARDEPLQLVETVHKDPTPPAA